MTKHKGGGTRPCELCGRDASLYCDSDSAFLCRSCDADVHQANFLVARHLRQTLCSKCKALAGSFISGSAVDYESLRLPLCRSCTEENPAVSSLSEEEEDDDDDCVSSAESSAVRGCVNKAKETGRKRIASSSSSISDVSGGYLNVGLSGKRRKTASDSRAEGIFVIWSRRLGLDGNSTVVSSARQALELCLERLNTTIALPFRGCLAASFWLGLKMCGHDAASSVATWQNLKRLETVSGVPAKLIVAIERRLARVVRLRKAKPDLKEDWAECDV